MAPSQAEVITGPLNETGDFSSPLPLQSINPHPFYQPEVGLFLSNILITTTADEIVYSANVLPIRILDPSIASIEMLGIGNMRLQIGSNIRQQNGGGVFLLAGVESSRKAVQIGGKIMDN